MKALVLKERLKLRYEEVPEPELGPSDVLIEVKACGICGSDVHGVDGSTGRRIPPVVMGHEASGVIAKTGAAVEGWKPGDRVTFDSTVFCGECRFCRSGHINLCDNRRVLGVSCAEYRRDGAFAEFVAVPQHILFRLPDSLSFEKATMVEALSIAVHAVGRAAPKLNDAAIVMGAGMIGLLVVQTLKRAGCGKVIAVDIDGEKLALARKLGASCAIDSSKPDASQRILDETDGRGADLAFEVVGVAPTVNLAVKALRKGGLLTLVGNLSSSIEFPLQAVVTREISALGSCASCGEYPAALDLIARKEVDVDPLISAVAPLSEGASWFERLYKKEKGLMKVILKP